MYPHQAERLTEALERAHIEALVGTSAENIAYITGFLSVSRTDPHASEFGVFARGGTALVISASETSSVVADGIDVDHVVCFGESRAFRSDTSSAEARRLRAIVATAAPEPVDALAAALDRLGVQRGSIGVDDSRLNREAGERLAARFPDLRIMSAAGELAAARRVKGPYEIECLGHALRIAEEALDAVIQAIDRGMTEREVATLLTVEVVKRGGWPRPPMVTMGERTGIVASWPTDRALRVGNLVRFDVGCTYKGYCSNVGRTAVLGEPSARADTLYQAVQAGLEAAISVMAVGVPTGRVFREAVEALRRNGLPDYDADHVGHGIGLEPRESPLLAIDSETRLQLGEVLNVEASHSEIGSEGLSVRDTVLITTAGARVLNRSRHGLVVLD